jgi:hypothetical protein
MTIVRGWSFSEVLRYRHAAAGVNEPRMFVVERNQREYSWKPADQVVELFEDLDEHLASNSTNRYVMGSLIFCPRDTVSFETSDDLASATSLEIIDGQQRILTLVALLAVVRHTALRQGNAPTVVLKINSALDGVRFDHHEDTMRDLMMSLIDNDGRVDIANLPVFPGTARSASNMVVVLEELQKRVSELFNRDTAALAYFVDLVLQTVLFSVTVAGDRNNALLAFERANNRGMVLDPTDLIKNFVFIVEDEQTEQSEDRWDEIDKRWKDVRELAESGSPKLKFADAIRWHHRATSPTYLVLSGAQLYGKVQDDIREQFSGTGLAYVKYLEGSVRWITKAHRAGVRTLDDGSEIHTDALLGLIMIRGQSQMKQHLPLLLAARDWSDTEFDDFARALEAVMFVATVLSVRPQEVETTVNAVLQQLKQSEEAISDEECRRAVTDLLLQKAIYWAADRDLVGSLAKLRYSVPSEVRLIRYILARVDAAVRATSRGEPAYMLTSFREVQKLLDRRTSTPHVRDDLDHIWPTGLWAKWKADQELRDSIGNLVLWTVAENRSARAAPAVEKLQSHYRASLENIVKYLLAVGPEAHENYRWAAEMGLRRADKWGVSEVSMLSRFYAKAIMTTLGISKAS